MKNHNKILKTIGEIQEYMGIGRTLYNHFMKLGLPVVTINGQKYAHADNLDEWARVNFKIQTEVNLPEELSE